MPQGISSGVGARSRSPGTDVPALSLCLISNRSLCVDRVANRSRTCSNACRPHLRRDWAHPSPHLRRDCARRCHICTGCGSASPMPHLHRDSPHPCHSARGLLSPPGTSAPGVGSPPAASAPGLASPLLHLRLHGGTHKRDTPARRTPRVHICIGSGPHQHQDWPTDAPGLRA